MLQRRQLTQLRRHITCKDSCTHADFVIPMSNVCDEHGDSQNMPSTDGRKGTATMSLKIYCRSRNFLCQDIFDIVCNGELWTFQSINIPVRPFPVSRRCSNRRKSPSSDGIFPKLTSHITRRGPRESVEWQ